MYTASLSASDPQASSPPRVSTVLVCDLVESTAITERIGDIRAAELARRHDRMARDLLHRHEGREIDKTDGFLMLFDRPLQAVAFALDYQRGLRELGESSQLPLAARVGIHVGEVVVWKNDAADIADGAKPVEVEGLAKVVAARLMSLARPGQILLSETTRALAMRAHNELDASRPVRWPTHGRYRLKGVPTPMVVHEVGEPGIAPLTRPGSSSKATRELPWWRKPAGIAIEAAVALAVILVPIALSLRTAPAIAFAERDWVVVGDLQNLTSRPELSGALETAMKIGLSQSKHVNVVPDLQVEQALLRMQSEPGVALDREIGRQVAMREGARALILPTLSEVGGSVQVSAEIVDPESGVTVLSERVAGQGEASILPATDELLVNLRASLGESLASIERSSRPLSKITSPNTDALRAYSEAEESLTQGRLAESVLLLDEALRLDPDFAMAWLRLGILRLQYLREPLQAREALDRAAAQRERLSAREQLYLDGILATFESPAATIDKWKVTLRMYPDAATAHQNIGVMLLLHLQQPAEALSHFEQFAATRHPQGVVAHVGMAVALTQLGRFDEARAAAMIARNSGVITPTVEDVLPDLALRRYADVEARISALPDSTPAAVRFEAEMRGVAALVDAGRLQDARMRLAAMRGSIDGTSAALLSPRLDIAVATLDSLGGRAEAANLQRIVDAAGARLADAKANFTREAEAELLATALVALRAGRPEVARSALDGSAEQILDSGFVALETVWRAADCQQRASSEEVPGCAGELQAAATSFQSQAALMDMHLLAGDGAAARERARWLLGQRGLAVAESGNRQLQLLNLIDLQRALLISVDGPAATAQEVGDLRRLADSMDADHPLHDRAHALLETQAVVD